MTDTTRPSELVRSHLSTIFEWISGTDPGEFDRLLDAEYSTETFGLAFPFLARVEDVDVDLHRRYWVEVHEVLGRAVRVTNHWFDRNVPDLLAYLGALGATPDGLTPVERTWIESPAKFPASPPAASATPDLSRMSVRELLTLQAAAVRALRDRAVLRAGAAPVSELAELVVHRALPGSTLAPPVEASHDLTDPTWGRVQVKARLVAARPRPGQLQSGVFRSEHFDHAALVLLDETTYEVVRAVMVPVATVVERWRRRERQNGWVVQMNGPTMDHVTAVDITDLAHAAFEAMV